jgi:hypothetical protein
MEPAPELRDACMMDATTIDDTRVRKYPELFGTDEGAFL